MGWIAIAPKKDKAYTAIFYKVNDGADILGSKKPLKFPLDLCIIYIQRVAFMRNSGCVWTTRLFFEQSGRGMDAAGKRSMDLSDTPFYVEVSVGHNYVI